jgi:shikimate dehydrogenase
VLGSPVSHSLSPAIHRAAYAALGLDWSYDAVDLQPAQLRSWVDDLDEQWRGLSVTMPLKEEAARCGRPSDDVRLTGVANTVLLEDDGRRVLNTDISGFSAALAGAGVPSGLPSLIVGNGATARSAFVALVRSGSTRITVTGRRAEGVAEFLRWASWSGIDTHALEWGRPPDSETRLLVSTVPAAGASSIVDPLTEHAAGLVAVFDAIYHPWPTPLAARVAELGGTLVSGLDLLVHQAAFQVQLMTGREVAIEVLTSAVRAELRRRAAA